MKHDLKTFLDQHYQLYNQASFITNDPISIPHAFERKEDIEIAGFLAATLAWGQRKTILNKSLELISLMENKPFDFLLQSDEKAFKRFIHFKHRTFNGDDALSILNALKMIYQHHGGLEQVFNQGFALGGAYEAIELFFDTMFQYPHLKRSEKHLARPSKGSAAKRINMFLRWMVRKDNREVDFGIWNSISMAELICPLDVHSGTTARKLGLLKRTTNDWRAALELTENLRKFDVEDPVKYDFALFGLGVNKNQDF